MKRIALVSGIVLVLAGLGVGGWFAWRGRGEEREVPAVKGHAKLIEELQSKRDHVTLVISGRLMAEIFPCG